MKHNVLSRIAGLCAAAVMLCPAAAFPAAGDSTVTFDDGVVTYEKISGGLKIVSVDSSTTELHLKRDVDGMPLLTVGEDAFSQCSVLQTLTFESGITEFETAALYGCSALTTLKLPDTLTKIGEGAFAFCSSLTALELPDSVTEIGAYAFSNCSRLEHITLPKGVKVLMPYTFQSDLLLESVTLNEGLEEISSAAFMNCLVLNELNIPASVQKIGEVAVVACPAITAVRVAEGNPNYKSTEDGVLTDLAGTTLMLYPGNREETAYTVPDSVKTIAPYAFSYSMTLESLTLPDTVQEIGAAAVSNCWKLREVRYPETMETIGSSVFADCNALEQFTIPEGVKQIESCAFMRCSALTGITLPAAVETVGEYAFAGCTAMHEVTVPKTVKNIGDYAFGYDAQIAEDSTITATKLDSFKIICPPDSAAKTYAVRNKVNYELDGFDVNVIISIAISVAAVVLLVGAVFLLYRKRKHTAEKAAAQSEPEEYKDPNYQSILEDDDEEEGDPYDRSYGFRTEDGEDEPEPKPDAHFPED